MLSQLGVIDRSLPVADVTEIGGFVDRVVGQKPLADALELIALDAVVGIEPVEQIKCGPICTSPGGRTVWPTTRQQNRSK